MSLTSEESEILLDYFFRCAGKEQIDRGSALIASNPKAAELYSCIGQTLAQLKHMEDDGCPDELVDLTVARLKLATVKNRVPHKNGS